MTTPGFPYRFSATPPEVYRGAPLTGEQTREILAELGYDGDRWTGWPSGRRGRRARDLS